MQISFQIFDLILRNFISFFWDFNGGSTKKEHLQILILTSKGKMMERWKCTPFNATKTGVNHRHLLTKSTNFNTAILKNTREKLLLFYKKHVF